jgi:hypothetical protein
MLPSSTEYMYFQIEEVRWYKGRHHLMWFILQLLGVANTQWKVNVVLSKIIKYFKMNMLSFSPLNFTCQQDSNFTRVNSSFIFRFFCVAVRGLLSSRENY